LRTTEALLLLLLVGGVKRVAPMRYWAFLLGRPRPVPGDWRGRAVERLARTGPASGRERLVVQAVHRAGRRLPWRPSCLAQAAAGQVMLRRRGSAGVVVIGLRPGAGGGSPAHAWLLGPSGPLLGAAASTGFTPVTVFETGAGVRAEDVPLEPAP
jgi:hypothetical protein